MSEPFAITCPRCGREGRTPVEPAAGSKVRCPGCKAQFNYAAPEEFVIVEPPPGHVKPAISKPAPDRTWLYAIGGLIGFGLAVSSLVAASKPGASWPASILAGLVLIVVAASPVVLVVCLLIMLAKYAAKQAMREVDAERAKR